MTTALGAHSLEAARYRACASSLRGCALSRLRSAGAPLQLSMLEGRVTGKWVRVANLSELPTEGLGHAVKAEGLDIALFRWNDRVYAIEDLCPHLGFPLSEGIMQAGEVICSWHGWHIRLEDGTCRRERERAKVWECEIRDGEVFVEI
jgi:NAD(P)H-dependent nitrite reductase small subunit